MSELTKEIVELLSFVAGLGFVVFVLSIVALWPVWLSFYLVWGVL